MKRNVLQQGLLSTCVFVFLLLTTTVQAQDNYWLLDGNKCLNTATGAVISNAALGGPASNPYVRTVYDPSGTEMFSYGANDVTMYGEAFSYTGGVQVFPIPDSCKQYYLLSLSLDPGAHITHMTLTKIDATVSGQPVTTTQIGLVNLDVFNYGAVVSKLDTGGTRFLYFLSRTPTNNATCDLRRYTISSNGSVSSGFTPIAGGFPQCSTNTRIKMAPDGLSLAYTDVNGQLVTYKMGDPGAFSYNTTALGMAQVTVGSTRRWYVSTGSNLGYFTEGNATFTSINSVIGIHSDVEQGKDGNLYVANGTLATPGTLAYFSPNAATPFFNSINDAQIVGLNSASAPTAYTFGNNVEGEDINLSQVPASLSFTVNGLTSTTTTQ